MFRGRPPDHHLFLGSIPYPSVLPVEMDSGDNVCSGSAKAVYGPDYNKYTNNCRSRVQTSRFFNAKVVLSVHHFKEVKNIDILVGQIVKMWYRYKMAAINVNHVSFYGTPCIYFNNEFRNTVVTFCFWINQDFHWPVVRPCFKQVNDLESYVNVDELKKVFLNQIWNTMVWCVAYHCKNYSN